MFDRIMSGRAIGRTTVLAGVVMGPLAVSLSSAVAGQCPADQVKTNAREAASHAAKGVTDTVLAAIDLEKEPAMIKERQLRFRKLTIEPGGIVPWHSHGDRPAIIYVAEGEIIEYASTCAVPIVQRQARSGRRPTPRRIGGRTRAARPSCCSWAMCSTTRTTRTCDLQRHSAVTAACRTSAAHL